MQLRSKIKTAVLAWAAAELMVLAIAVRMFGWPLTLALGFATSVIGFYVIRNAGRDGLATLKRTMSGPPGREIDASDGLVRVASGFLLVAPGFVSDVIGLVLLLPIVRSSLTRRFAPVARTAPDGVVDLDPAEWRRGAAQPGGTPCEPLSGMLPGEPKTAQSRRRDDE